MNFKTKAAETNKSTEEFLDHKRKKTWIDKQSGHKCFMLYPRSLFITWGSRDHWSWNCFKETSDENVEVVKLRHVCWLDVRGKFKMSDLSAGVLYEIVYVVKLTNAAFGWEMPIRLKLSVPGGGGDAKVQNRQVTLLEMPRGEWLELSLGTFFTKIHDHESQDTAEVSFDLFEHGGHWKSGLIIKAAILRPKYVHLGKVSSNEGVGKNIEPERPKPMHTHSSIVSDNGRKCDYKGGIQTKQ